MSDSSAIFTFPTTHHALKAEQVLKSAPFKATIIPVPRELTSLCGLAIKVDPAYQTVAEQTLADSGVKIDQVFILPQQRRGSLGLF